MILVTGGAGFIGSNFIKYWLQQEEVPVVILDKLSYAGKLDNLQGVLDNSAHVFIKGDILDKNLISSILTKYSIRYVVHFAAESHVDNSIEAPDIFFLNNVMGTQSLIESVREYWSKMANSDKNEFRFLHVSTDEVYGALTIEEDSFTEESKYKPNSPYSASKASSDHIVRAYNRTYGLPTIITNCSNNYGPHQLEEKLIPHVIYNAVQSKPIPVYGKGNQIRDWLYVEDHCRALYMLLHHGRVGECYNIGGNCEISNIRVIETICSILDEIKPRNNFLSYLEQVVHVRDRAGHDFRYSINNQKIKSETGWEPMVEFNEGLQSTVKWYLDTFTRSINRELVKNKIYSSV